MESPKAIYEALRKEGWTEKDAAKEAQKRTGLSVVSGRPIDKNLIFTKKKIYQGQYGQAI